MNKNGMLLLSLLIVSLNGLGATQTLPDDTPIAQLERRPNIQDPKFDERLFETHLAEAKVDYVIDKMASVARNPKPTREENEKFLKTGQHLVDRYAELSRQQRIALIECLTIKPDQA